MARLNVKYKMRTRKEDWKTISDPLENQYIIPLEQQPSVIKELVSSTCYKRLVSLLDLPPVDDDIVSTTNYADSDMHFSPAENGSTEVITEADKNPLPKYSNSLVGSEESLSYQCSSETRNSLTVPKDNVAEHLTVQESNTDKEYEALSNFVEVDKHARSDKAMMMKHKAILKFLALAGTEVASWRLIEPKGVGELNEMTLEQQGDFLINKIAVDFCEWIRKLGGDEKSFINEEILKELFEICMDNPASRAICIKTREKKVLYYKLAEFLQVPKKSFQQALSSHLNWSAKVEKLPSKLVAFDKALPKDLQFKTPTNKTSETWLKWKSFSTDQLRSADIYSFIKDLRSTKEYCKWLLNHPERKKPQYLIEQGCFDLPTLGTFHTMV